MQNSHIKNTVKVSEKKCGNYERLLLVVLFLYVFSSVIAFRCAGESLFVDVYHYARLVILAFFACDCSVDLVLRKRRLNLASVCIGLCGVLIGVLAKQAHIVMLVILLFEFSKFELRDVVKYFVAALGAALILVVSFSLLGIYENTEFARGDKTRYGLGFSWTTNAPSIFSFFCLGYVFVRKSKITYAELIILTVAAIPLYIFTDSRISFAITIIGVIIGVCGKIFANKSDFRFKSKAAETVAVLIPWLLAALSFICVALYSADIPVFNKLNDYLSNRLYLANQGLKEYGFTLFRSDIEWHTWNQITFFDSAFEMFFVDNSYVKIFLEAGIVGLFLVLFGYSLAIKASFNKDRYLTALLLLVLVYGFIVPNLIGFTVNPFVFSLSFFTLNKCERRKKEHVGGEIYGNVAAVIVSYNRKELLREAVQALLKSDYAALKIIVVDNASTDGTSEYIQDLKSDKVLYFNTGANLGGAGGFNFGIKKAMETGADYVWIMDDDCIVQENSLAALINFAKSKNNDFGYLSSKVLWKDGTLSKMNIQRRSIGDKKFNAGINGQKIRIATFVSLFINANAIEKVGLPIKEFFIWGDDWEYTYRLSDIFDCYYVADSVVVHKSAVNMGSNIAADDLNRLNRYFYSYRNEGYLYRKIGLKGELYYLCKVAYHILKIVFSKNKNKIKRFSILIKGAFASKSFNPDIEYFDKKDNREIIL
ncbi:MAG: glycosyltransferase [Clostridia bacterium]|nr:glycosyltransferase [Clostridia bacterium]